MGRSPLLEHLAVCDTSPQDSEDLECKARTPLKGWSSDPEFPSAPAPRGNHNRKIAWVRAAWTPLRFSQHSRRHCSAASKKASPCARAHAGAGVLSCQNHIGCLYIPATEQLLGKTCVYGSGLADHHFLVEVLVLESNGLSCYG